MKRAKQTIEGARYLDTKGLAAWCCVGTSTARRLSKLAGAEIRIGSMVRHDVRRIEKYLTKED